MLTKIINLTLLLQVNLVWWVFFPKLKISLWKKFHLMEMENFLIDILLNKKFLCGAFTIKC